MANENIKILHCPDMVGGHPQELSRAERKAGYESKSLCLVESRYQYRADEFLWDEKAGFLRRHFCRWSAILKMVIHYDIIHYNFGQSLAPIRSLSDGWKTSLYNALYAKWAELCDLKLIHYLGRVVAVTYQGDDARQGDYCRAHYPIHHAHAVDENYYLPKMDKWKRERIKVFEKYADIIYALNPDLLNVLPPNAKFLPYANVNPHQWKYVGVNSTDCPHVVHAPSHRSVKGTEYILDAFKKLEQEGVSFCYTLVEGCSNDEAKKIYETADIIVDQLLAGFYGGFSVECMALGKPVICYMRENDLIFLPEEMRNEIPVINANPDNIYSVLKSWLTDKKPELMSIGKRSRQFVERWHDPDVIASQIIDDYKKVLQKKRGK